MYGDLVPQGLGDGTGFPQTPHPLDPGTIRRFMSQKGQNERPVSVCSPRPLPLRDCSMCPWATASPFLSPSPPDPVSYTDCWKQRDCLQFSVWLALSLLPSMLARKLGVDGPLCHPQEPREFRDSDVPQQRPDPQIYSFPLCVPCTVDLGQWVTSPWS